MGIFVRKYLWTVNLATIALCALLLARGVGRVVMAQVPPVAPAKRSAAAPPAPLQAGGPDISQVLERNIFCSTCEPATERGAAGATASSAPATTTLDLKLIATLVSPVDSAHSYATIRDPSAEVTGLYGIGNRVPGDAVVTDITDRQVLLEQNGETAVLELATTTQSSKPPPAPPRAQAKPRPGMPKARPEVKKFAQGIRRLGPNKWEIDRSALNGLLANTTLIARSARIVPSVRNGKPNGFRLFAVRKGSFYSLLGMFNGDTIQAINGHPITTPDKALEVYTKLRSASHVSISFTRRNTPITHEYLIR